MAELDKNAQKEIDNTFAGQANALNGINDAVKNSPFLADLINKFVSNQGKIIIGQPDCGTYTSNNGKLITIDPKTIPRIGSISSENNKLFVVELAHELGHAVLPGGFYQARANIDDKLMNTRNAEGIAVASEYITSKQLGLMQTYSDSVNGTDAIFLGLENAALSCSLGEGKACFPKDANGEVNLAGVTLNSPGVAEFTKVDTKDNEQKTSKGIISGGNDYMDVEGSTSSHLTYRQRSALDWLNHELKISNNIDFQKIKPVFEANPDGTLKKGPDGSYTIAKGASIPLKTGGRVDIQGNVSASGLVTIDTQAYDSASKPLVTMHFKNNPDGTSRIEHQRAGDASTTTTHYTGRNGAGDPINQAVERKPTAPEQGPGQNPGGKVPAGGDNPTHKGKDARGSQPKVEPPRGERSGEPVLHGPGASGSSASADGKSGPTTGARADKAPAAGRVEFSKAELEAARREREAYVKEIRAAREAAKSEPAQGQNNAKDAPNATEQNNAPRSGWRR